MPRALEPGLKFPIWLDSDQDKQPRPTFFYRALNGREYRQLAEVLDVIDTESSRIERLDRVFQLARFGLVGWENISNPETKEPLPFQPADLDLVVGFYEAQELAKKVIDLNHPDPDAKKNSALPPSSSTEKSAVCALGENAGIAQQNGNHSASPAPSATS